MTSGHILQHITAGASYDDGRDMRIKFKICWPIAIDIGLLEVRRHFRCVLRNKSFRYVLRVDYLKLFTSVQCDFLCFKLTTIWHLQGWKSTATFWSEWTVTQVTLPTPIKAVIKLCCQDPHRWGITNSLCSMSSMVFDLWLIIELALVPIVNCGLHSCSLI